ncbi:MAG: hypothetical protein DI551_11840 [Micavibrio aeruginosavorus]|uniref:Uncharacterized protein n=1 Tax=Micavibrio aeruginosavorus TaxID=349221 RepID=A0A2W5MQX4_9BACT|nr:MAG: hypothetical protein DI551_11840 [Micavibrio aeruginosavorus]
MAIDVFMDDHGAQQATDVPSIDTVIEQFRAATTPAKIASFAHLPSLEGGDDRSNAQLAHEVALLSALHDGASMLLFKFSPNLTSQYGQLHEADMPKTLRERLIQEAALNFAGERKLHQLYDAVYRMAKMRSNGNKVEL